MSSIIQANILSVQKDIDTLKTEINTLKTEINTLKAKITAKSDSISGLQEQADSTRQIIEGSIQDDPLARTSLEADLNFFNSRIKHLKEEETKLEGELKQARADLTKLEGRLEKLEGRLEKLEDKETRLLSDRLALMRLNAPAQLTPPPSSSRGEARTDSSSPAHDINALTTQFAFLVNGESLGSVGTNGLKTTLTQCPLVEESFFFDLFKLPSVANENVAEMVKQLDTLAIKSETDVQKSPEFNAAFYDVADNGMADTHAHYAVFQLPQRDNRFPGYSQTKSGKPDGTSRRISMVFEIKGSSAKEFEGLLQGIERGVMLATTHGMFKRFFVLIADKDQFWLVYIDCSDPIAALDRLTIQLFHVSSLTLCKLWRALSLKSAEDLSFFLCEDAHVLRRVLELKQWPWQDCRIQLVGVSGSKVYKILPSNKILDCKCTSTTCIHLDDGNALVIKVCASRDRFATERDALAKIAPCFGEAFYASGFYDVETDCIKDFATRPVVTKTRSDEQEDGQRERLPAETNKNVDVSEKESEKTAPRRTTRSNRKGDGQRERLPAETNKNVDVSEKESEKTAPRTTFTDTWFCDGTLNTEVLRRSYVGALLMRCGVPVGVDCDKTLLLDDLLDGLKRIHQAGILHCDIRKPNIMRFAPGGYQIVDFDLAVCLPPGKDSIFLHNISESSGQAMCFPPSKLKELRKNTNCHGNYVTWKASHDFLMLMHTLMNDFGVTKEDF